jgi:hypothetical protein
MLDETSWITGAGGSVTVMGKSAVTPVGGWRTVIVVLPAAWPRTMMLALARAAGPEAGVATETLATTGFELLASKGAPTTS